MALADRHGGFDRGQQAADDAGVLVQLQEVLGLDGVRIAVAERGADPFPGARPVIAAALFGGPYDASLAALSLAELHCTLVGVTNAALRE